MQRKLSKVHVPHIVGELVVCGVHLGGSVPQLRSVASPHQDERGLWCDLEVEYQGDFTMTIETKLDLMKLKKTDTSLSAATSESNNSNSNIHGLVNSSKMMNTAGGGGGFTPTASIGGSSTPFYHSYSRSASSTELLMRDIHFDTDTDDSVESSSEDEYEEDMAAFDSSLARQGGIGGASGGGGGKRLLKLVDSVAGNRYFQQATEWKVLQKAMKGVSNTRIVLSVKVERLCGTLAINIPPQPSDRLWYGFRTPPELIMRARPRLGDRTLNLPFLAEFIQKQLHTVFEKVFVLPNMDDLVVPIMSPLLPGQTNLPKPPWDTTSVVTTTNIEPTAPQNSFTRKNSKSHPSTPDEH